MLNVGQGRRDLFIALAGRTVSTFGDGVAVIALTLRLQGDGAHPYQVGLLLAAGSLPVLLLARPVGRLVDTHDSRLLLVGGGLVEVAATTPLIFLHAVAPIVVLVVALGAAASVTSATWSALIPRVVGEEHLAQAISAQQSLGVLVLVGAPAVGALLAGAFGTGVPIAIDAFTFVILTVATALIRTRRVPGRAPAADRAIKARGGFAILRADQLLAPLLVGIALVVLLVGMVDVVLVYLVRETLHAGAVWYGVTEAAWMAGMVAGAVVAGRVRTERGQSRATIAGAAIACGALAGFAVAPAVAVLVPLSVLGGIGNGYAGTCLSTLLMTRTAETARGRVSAAANAILGGAQGASLLLGGVLAVVLSPRELYAAAGLLGLAAAGLLAIRHRSPEAALRESPSWRPARLSERSS
ncbi:MAG TPA: MFS transporter [Gaiellaceae bacterium]|nr:MFS transporter [Gaiellaceae bacterium]